MKLCEQCEERFYKNCGHINHDDEPCKVSEYFDKGKKNFANVLIKKFEDVDSCEFASFTLCFIREMIMHTLAEETGENEC